MNNNCMSKSGAKIKGERRTGAEGEQTRQEDETQFECDRHQHKQDKSINNTIVSAGEIGLSQAPS